MNLTRIGIAAVLAVTCFTNVAHAEDAAPAAPAASSAAAAAPAAAAPEPAAQPSAPAAVTAEPPAASSHRTLWPWIIMGGGIGLVATSIVFEVHAVREADKRDADEIQLSSLGAGDLQRATLQASVASHDDSAKSARTTALIIGSVGFVAIAGSVILWFVEGSAAESSDANASASAAGAKTKAAKKTFQTPSLLPSFAPGYAGASFGATF